MNAEKKPSSRPPGFFVEPPRTKSGEMGAVKAYRSKLESIAEHTYSASVELTDKIGDFLADLRATNAPPAVNPPPPELPQDEDDIIGWDETTDAPIRRRDLRLRMRTPSALEFDPIPVPESIEPVVEKTGRQIIVPLPKLLPKK